MCDSVFRDPVGKWLPSPRGGALAKGVEALRADRDLGYRGGRQTGLAFIEETHLLPGEVVWDETVGQDNQCFWRCDSTVVGGASTPKGSTHAQTTLDGLGVRAPRTLSELPRTEGVRHWPSGVVWFGPSLPKSRGVTASVCYDAFDV